jgi:hypothetical protein
VALKKESDPMDFFSGIEQASLKIGSQESRWPMFYRDVGYVCAYVLAPLDKVREVLPSQKMHPFRLTPWHGIVTITASQYRDSDIGPYNAVSIGVPIVLDKAVPIFTGILRKPPEDPMIYLLYLPVSSEMALATGVKVAAFPEFLADIRIEDDGQWIRCRVDAEGKNILSLSGRKLDAKPYPRQRVHTITLRQDRLLRSELNFSEGQLGISRKKSDVLLELGDHPIGLKLKGLNLGRVLEYQCFPAGQALLSNVCESYGI